jgi:flavin reductase (DIM6/NTAB) family NADH-FMN oxidoreductase RutF
MRKDLGVKAYLYPQPTLVIATYNEDGSTNAMVAAWGSISDTNQVAIYVAHSHKTMPNILARKAFTVSMANSALGSAVPLAAPTASSTSAQPTTTTTAPQVKGHLSPPGLPTATPLTS